jgi:hypothetical protein
MNMAAMFLARVQAIITAADGLAAKNSDLSGCVVVWARNILMVDTGGIAYRIQKHVFGLRLKLRCLK